MVKFEKEFTTEQVQMWLRMLPSTNMVVMFIGNFLANNMKVRTWRLTIEEVQNKQVIG